MGGAIPPQPITTAELAIHGFWECMPGAARRLAGWCTFGKPVRPGACVILGLWASLARVMYTLSSDSFLVTGSREAYVFWSWAIGKHAKTQLLNQSDPNTVFCWAADGQTALHVAAAEGSLAAVSVPALLLLVFPYAQPFPQQCPVHWRVPFSRA
jgi:hypothetical protein